MNSYFRDTALAGLAAIYVLLIGMAGGMAAADIATNTPSALNQAAVPFQITTGPYLQAPATNSMTLVWAANRKGVGKVEYRGADGQTKTAAQSEHGLISANTTLHRVQLDGLTPGTRYTYRVTSTEILDFQAYKVVYGETIRSQEGQFTTLDGSKTNFSWVVLNDRHEKVEPLVQALKSIHWDGVDLVFFNGDMLNYLVSEEQVFQNFIRPACQVFAGRIPFVWNRGNHEARGSFARMLMDYFPSPTQRYYRAFTHGGVRFVLLDSGEDKTDSSPEYSGLVNFEPYMAEETKWLQEEIRGAAFREARFRVVLSHMPPGKKTRDPYIRSQYLLDHWVPLFNEGGLDLLLCAHTHHYTEVPPAAGKNSYLMVVGGIDTIIRVDATASQLQVTTLNNDGSPKSRLPAIGARQ